MYLATFHSVFLILEPINWASGFFLLFSIPFYFENIYPGNTDGGFSNKM